MPGARNGRARFRRIGMVARWRPVHLGHAAVLKGLVELADDALIGIGSVNRYDARNPFTPAEAAEVIRRVLAGHDNYHLISVRDLGHGPRWRAQVVNLFGPVDLFASANPWVKSLLEDAYQVIHPAQLVEPSKRVKLEGVQVRRALAVGYGWRKLVPEVVADYIESEGLAERVQREFGAEIRAESAVFMP